MTSVLFIGILVAQVLGTWLWVEQLKSSEKTRVTNISKELGSYIAQAVGFFEKLPSQYREETLSQLRQNGGTFLDFGAEFFVTSNNQYVDLSQITNSEFSILFRENLENSLNSQIGQVDDLNIRFVKFSDAQTMIPNSPSEGLTNNQILASLSPIWRSLGLVAPNSDSPVAIIQFRLKNQNDWMYLASIIPKGELLLSFDWVNGERIFTSILVSITMLLITFLFVRWLVSPLQLLAKQADLLGKGRFPRQLEEKGSKEIIATIRAFNSMARRIKKFIADRERSFASISHDLRTPLTRARLRVEGIEDEEIKENLIEDLEYLETMVKSSLQTMTDGIEHENTIEVELTKMLKTILKQEEILGLPIKMTINKEIKLRGRAIALERLFSNLINNALIYGGGVEVSGKQKENGIFIQIMDRGPGLTDSDKENVFKPYYRLENKLSDSHSGLGMGIARNIANIHGGELELKDRAGGGLIVEVYFPVQ
jgi:signal transduction histidine kinase|tara:strand:+ start:403 stop:1848 length:1446 start_codon:yes stop_codon:yes gene_type:complete